MKSKVFCSISKIDVSGELNVRASLNETHILIIKYGPEVHNISCVLFSYFFFFSVFSLAIRVLE